MKSVTVFTGLGAAAAMLAPSCKSDHQDQRPNIVYILADDLGYGDLSCLNPESRIQTPHMDRMANQGMTFLNAHSPSAVSTPTRYGILTGRYCFRSSLKSGVLTGYSPALIEQDQTTVAEVLKNQGYQTACIGKWHLGLNWPRKDTTLPLFTGDEWAPESVNVDYSGFITGGPNDLGFDYSFIIPASLDIVPYCFIENQRLTAPVTGRIGGSDSPRGVFWRAGDIQQNFKLEEVLPSITRKAEEFIRHQSGKQPFFLYLPLTSPHTPWLPGEAFKGKSGAGTYGDFIMQTDSCVGIILDALKKAHLDGNTLVILTSDNGSNWTRADLDQWKHRSNGVFRGQKSDVWEGGHHIPFIAQWPGIILEGSHSEQLLCLTDLFATAAEITGYKTKPGEGPDSFSFLFSLKGNKPEMPVRESVVVQSISGMSAIIEGPWKLIDGRGSGGWSDRGDPQSPPFQLYNLKEDISETTNRWEENQKLADELLGKMKGILK
jgi:arylsulfatase A-like enzyme